MDFWRSLEDLLASGEVVIDRVKGSRHPRFPSCVYPVDYGYVRGTSGGDGQELDLWRGSIAQGRLVGIVCTVDRLKRDAEIKLLLGCTVEETESILRFHNEDDMMSAVHVKRG